MPYKRRLPVPEEEMDKRMKNEHTICNTLRTIYHLTADPEIRIKCRLAFAMGKSMCNKLAAYREMYEPGFQLKELQEREPSPLWEMDKTRWEGHHSICQTIRDIYHMSEDCDLKIECRRAMSMTKAMHEKLKAYKQMEVGG